MGPSSYETPVTCKEEVLSGYSVLSEVIGTRIKYVPFTSMNEESCVGFHTSQLRVLFMSWSKHPLSRIPLSTGTLGP